VKTVTQWFLGEKPVHVGQYERFYASGNVWLCWWDGEEFLMPSSRLVVRRKNYPSAQQGLPWRGLAEPATKRKSKGK
jgi:hypothetical protein